MRQEGKGEIEGGGFVLGCGFGFELVVHYKNEKRDED